MESALENHGWRNCCGQASQDLWKMEFKDMESTLGDMEVNVGLEMDLGKKIMETILKQTAARKQKNKLKESYCSDGT